MVPDSPPPPAFGLEGFAQPQDQDGMSLEKLTSAFAEMLGARPEPYDAAPPESAAAPPALGIGETADDRADDGACALTPRSILEAMLFVGHPQNQPLTSEQIAATMRGVSPAEIDELAQELNRAYAAAGCPYEIVSQGAGYQLAVRAEYESLRRKLYGKVREARLSQQAVELLAIVAYHQPATAEQIASFRGAPGGALLNQLVRRQLLSVERTPPPERRTLYRTTERFLKLFGLDDLSELPRGVNAEPR